MKHPLAVHKLPIDVGDWGIVIRWNVDPVAAGIPGLVLSVSLIRETEGAGEMLRSRDASWLNGQYIDLRYLPFAKKAYYLKIIYETEDGLGCKKGPKRIIRYPYVYTNPVSR
jgi:hypothetical protein